MEVLKDQSLEHRNKDERPTWTQDEAIAYECACEVLRDMMGIYNARIYAEERKANPDTEKLKRMEDEVSRLFREEQNLQVHDHEKIAEFRRKYGEIIRAHRANVKAAIGG
ncbi:hypothetical protein LJC71_01850 [Desulfosarcina sp. OttesenSCG-928-A07]|nr:hypothetical protein [Desulfosarcina sp. OttesenSCG-928-G17]MDL2328481.1 hypothetical protein [Desulfosarcina sp. OttesenSCG-928-A07]